MKRIIIFIIFLITIFIVNILFYYLSSDYRIFLKKIKNKEWDIELQEKSFYDNKIDDEININNDLNIEDEIDLIDNEIWLSTKNEELFEKKDEKTWIVEFKNEVTLWKNYLEILDLFSNYDLNKLEFNSSLFDITNEYPDNYFEYYSKDLTLYLFPTKTYNEILDIFNILKDELPFDINEVNNFWDKSFFLNLDNDIQDRFIRIVITNKWIVFWLKIKRTNYDEVKNKLNSLTKV